MDPRRKTWELCGKDLVEAASFARGVKDEWYRCQSLATVAFHTKSRQDFMKLAEDSLKAARQLPSPNRKVTCSAWIINAMAKRGDIDITEAVEEMLTLIHLEENPVRRADALLKLFEAVYPMVEIRNKVLATLLDACDSMKSWKQPIVLSDIALVLALNESEEAQKILEMITDRAVKRKTLKAIDDGKWLGPHEFFPYYTKIPEAHPVR